MKLTSQQFKKIGFYITLFAMIGFISYVLVFKAAYVPFGYNVISHDKTTVELQSTSIFGKKKSETVTFTKEDEWIEEILMDAVKRQKEQYWFLFTVIPFSLWILVNYIWKGIWKGVIRSSIIFSILVSILPLWHTISFIRVLI